MPAASVPPTVCSPGQTDEVRVDVATLAASTTRFPPPTIVDVRRDAAFERDPMIVPGAIRRRPEDVGAWAGGLDRWRPVVVYCAHGHEVSVEAARALRERGLDAHALDGGLDAWRESGRSTIRYREPTRWVTRERPKIDRIACPWLLRRFVDPDARVDYVPAGEVLAHARRTGATPFDVPDVEYTHVGARCSFDAFVERHAIRVPGIERLAAIVRAADTGALDDAPEAAGLLAASLGLSRMIGDDQAMLGLGLALYDALYLACTDASGETHGWNPDALRAAR